MQTVVKITFDPDRPERLIDINVTPAPTEPEQALQIEALLARLLHMIRSGPLPPSQTRVQEATAQQSQVLLARGGK